MTKKTSIDEAWAARFAKLMVAAPATAAGPSQPLDPLEILTPEEMERADAMIMAAGTPGLQLMEAAGGLVAAAVKRRLPDGGRVVILAGPGNNGGDGFVVARLLDGPSYRVTVALLGTRNSLRGDAAAEAQAWRGSVVELTAAAAVEADLVVDALFGTGLDRPIAGAAAAAIAALNASGKPVISVDIPSGIDGRTGLVLGAAVNATETVTFFRLKPGLVLQPGRAHAGQIVIGDIGIETARLAILRPMLAKNDPRLWSLPRPSLLGNKYDRGHAVVVSGEGTRTGAARLAARGALRVGAGLVTVASPPDALAANAMHLTAIMLLSMEGPAGLAAILEDVRKNVVVLGPALGVGPRTVALVEAALATQTAVVLDADGLTSFAGAAERLFTGITVRGRPVVMTPHEGEFARLFPAFAGHASKIDRALEAAALSGAVVVLKGPDTVIASPEGRAIIADNAPPDLATAGAGDVLAGMIGGLLAQGMDGFDAAAAAVFLHGEAGRVAGRGLIAEDLPEALPEVFAGFGF